MLSVPCDLGTYRSMGKHSVAPVLILGWGGWGVYYAGLYPCSLCCNSGPYPWGGVLILGEFFLGLALINPLARRGGSARNVCMTYCPFFGEEFESVTLALIL